MSGTTAASIAIELGKTRGELDIQKNINRKSRAMIIRLSGIADRLTQQLLEKMIK